jgi:cell shape-determining protein MreC
MRKTITYPILGLIVFLFCWVNLPSLFSDRLREFVCAPFGKRTFSESPNELSLLKLENRNLRIQIEHAYELTKQIGDPSFLQKRAGHFKERLEEELQAMPARVIYRDPALWSSSLWVNVGEKTNRALKKKVIAKNSPVLAGDFLVGVVEFVGENQSRIRLITDSGLCPSVRVCRGSFQNRELARGVETLLKLLGKREDQTPLIEALQTFKESLKIDGDDGYFAKGEVHGSSTSFWRSRAPLLKGIGFNYDSDPSHPIAQAASILKEGDLLVTTGLDGVFPPDIPIATVAHVAPRQPSSYAYEIEAVPLVSNMNDLQTLFILPPVSE